MGATIGKQHIRLHHARMSEMQVPESYVPDVDDMATMCAFASAISLVENGKLAVMADVESGWNLL